MKTGERVCHIGTYISALGVIQSFIGGAGISLMRMLFIQFPNQVLLGDKATSQIIAVINLTVTLTSCYIWQNVGPFTNAIGFH